MNIAYLVNVYPAPSHSFIRREIIGLRRADINVQTFSIRRHGGALLTESDLEELDRTRVILDYGWVYALLAAAAQLAQAPRVSLRVIGKAVRMATRSDGGILRHVAYFIQACLLRKWLGEIACQHLHAHFGSNSAAVGMLCHELGGPPWSMTIHGPEEFACARKIALGERIAHARFVVGISEFTIHALRSSCDPAHWHKLKLIRCGVDQSFTSAPPTSVPDVHRIVCVGRLCERKMQHVLIDAIHLLVQRGHPIELTLVGNGTTRAALEAQVARLNLQTHVHFAGWCRESQVREHIQSSRVMVLPSRDEGLPVAIMEAYALCRPVISTPVAAIPELIEHDRSGWLVPPGDANALADAIETCLKMPIDQLSAMADIGRKRVRELHDADRNARQLAQLFPG